MIDLHGLYVGEALEYAELAFELAALEDDKVVRFIVGTSSLRAPRRFLKGSHRIQAKDYMQRMATRKFGRRWKNSVKSTFGISDCYSPFYILTLVDLKRSFTYYLDPKNECWSSYCPLLTQRVSWILDIMLTCKLRLVLYCICITMLALFTRGCSIFLKHSTVFEGLMKGVPYPMANDKFT